MWMRKFLLTRLLKRTALRKEAFRFVRGLRKVSRSRGAVFGLVALLAVSLWAGEARPQQKPLFWLDLYRFRTPTGQNLLDVALAVERNRLLFKPADRAYVAAAEATIRILKGDSLLAESRLSFADTVARRSEVRRGQKLVDLKHYLVAPGLYTVRVELKDLLANAASTKQDTVRVEPADAAEDLVASDLLLASLIKPDPSGGGRLWRNGLVVVPNASRMYGTGASWLYYYAEVYGLKEDKEGRGHYRTDLLVLDEQNREVESYSGKEHLVGGSACAVNGRLDVRDFETGSYLLQVAVTDLLTGKRVLTGRQFFVVHRAVHAAPVAKRSTSPALGVVSSYALASEEELDREFERLKYIATKEELAVYPKLDLAGKRRFLEAFWKRRDPDPSTPENEARRDYEKRLEYANERFSYPGHEGWKTDRGRVLLQYGWPDQVDREPGGISARPFEVWTYEHVQGGVTFVFVDRRENGEFELIHSTARGELRDYNWQRYIPR